MDSMAARTPATDAPLPVAEAIAAKDLNNLYLTSCYFADPARYAAFCSLYALMRVIDDRVDELPQDPARFDIAAEHEVLRSWEEALFAAAAGSAPDPGLGERCGMAEARLLVTGAAQAMERFPIPLSLWRNFFLAMHRDVHQARFETYREFLDYTEGASVAPTSIYLFLIAARDASATGVYAPPEDFDLIRSGRYLGTFSYLAHILRDLALDLGTGERGLLYLAREDLERFGLDEAKLRRDLARGRASRSLRDLAAELAGRARAARDRGVTYLETLDGQMEPDCAFILEVILEIYGQALDKLAAASYDPMAGEHHLSLEEKLAAVARTAERLGFELPAVAPAGRPPTAAADAPA
jgi:phytoene synthase